MKFKILFSALLVGGLMSLVAFAADETTPSTSFPTPRNVEDRAGYKPHVGAQLGLATPEGSYDSGAEYGVDFGFQPYIPFAIGAELNHARLENEGAGEDLDRTTFMAKGTYNFGGDLALIKYSYVGAGLGLSHDTDTTRWVSAPLLGFDVPLNDVGDFPGVFSAGAMAKYAIQEGSSPDSLSLNGMLKYWF